MNSPPYYAIKAAFLAATESPCAKSKRGAVLFAPARTVEDVVARGFNGPPPGFSCKNTGACRANCAQVCLHAEQRAMSGIDPCFSLRDIELVHIKAVDGACVPGGGPSCLQCSRLIVEVGLGAVWLFEAQRWHDEIPCESCSAITIVKQGDGTTGVCEHCKPRPHRSGLLRLLHSKTVYAPDSGVWKRYAADEFHRATLDHNGLASLGVVA